MGNRGKDNPRRKKPASAAEPKKNNSSLPERRTNSTGKSAPKSQNKSSKTSISFKELSIIVIKQLKLAKVVIEPECKRLADQALFKKSGKEVTKNKVHKPSRGLNGESSQSKFRSVRSSNHKTDKKSEPNNNSNNGKSLKSNNLNKVAVEVRKRPTHRRKALSKALKKLRTFHTKNKRLQPKSGSGKEPRLSPRTRRNVAAAKNLRPRLQNSFIKSYKRIKRVDKKRQQPISIRRTKRRGKMDLNKKSPKSDQEQSVPGTSHHHKAGSDAELKANYSVSDSSSDEIQPPILEKPIPSDKEDSDEDDSMNTAPNDSDYESSLLSPSALPASSLFKAGSSKKSIKDKSKPGELLQQSLSSGSSSYPRPSLNRTSTPISSSFRPVPNTTVSFQSRRSPLPGTSSAPPVSRSYQTVFGKFPEKRGRGRPRKPLADLKSISGKLYRRKMAERLNASAENMMMTSNNLGPFDEPLLSNTSQSFTSISPEYSQVSVLQPQPHQHQVQKRAPLASPSSDPQNFRKRLQRWKDRSTFVYAKHKFVKNNADKFRCDTCQVNFTALSSLKRHYGTIYHKQQLGELEASAPTHGSSPGPGLTPPPSSGAGRGQARRVGVSSSSGSGNGDKKRLAPGGPSRTTSFIRKNAAHNIKKYYAAVDAARRNKVAGGPVCYPSGSSYPSSSTGSSYASAWVQQKQQRKRKPLQHSDFLYPSSSADSEGEDDRFAKSDLFFDRMGYENIENSYPDENEDDDDEDDDYPNNGLGLEKNLEEQKSWLSNKWKGSGTAHFTCEVCNEVYENKWDFTKHIYAHRQEEEKIQSLTCPDCQTSFLNEVVLKNHFKLFNHGPSGTNGTGRVKRFNCTKCGSAFSQRDYYKKHLETHKRPPIRCPHCPQIFYFKFYLADHIKAEHDGWSYVGNNGNLLAGLGNANSPVTLGSSPLAPTNLGNGVGSGTGVKSGKNAEMFQKSGNSGKGKYKCSLMFEEAGKKKGGDKGKGLPPKNVAEGTLSKSHVESLQEEVTLGITMPMVLDEDESNEKYGGEDAMQPEEEISMSCDAPTNSQLKQSEEPDPMSADAPDKQEAKLSEDDKEKESESNDNKEEVNLGSTVLSAVNNGPFTIDHENTASGEMMFQFEMPLPTDHSIIGEDLDPKEDKDLSSVSPLTIEIPHQAIMNADMDDERLGDAIEAMEDNANKDDMISSESQKLSSPLSSLANLPLIGCGSKSANLPVKPEENPLTCQDCGKIFEHRKSLVKHVHYYRQSEDYLCTICNKTFKLKHHVSRHMKSFHNIDTNSTTSSTTSEDQVDADFLNSPTGSGSTSMFPLPSSSSESAGKLVGGGGQKSPTSSKSTSGKERKPSSLSSPPLDRSSSESYTAEVEYSGETIFKCLVCLKLYPTRPQLNSHILRHNKRRNSGSDKRNPAGKGKFACDICPDKCFTWRKDLLRHKRVKHGIYNKKPNQETSKGSQPSPKRCSFCPMVFPEENDLNAHVMEEHKEDYINKKKDEDLTSEDDEDKPPTPSPHTSPIHTMEDHIEEDQEDVEEEEEPEAGRSSPEFELLELN